MKIGFIGAGNMAQAIFRGLLKQGIFAPETLYISDVLPKLTEKLHEELGVMVAADNRELVQKVDIVVLAVKPIYAVSVFQEIGDVLADQSVFSIISGFSFQALQAAFPKNTPLLRVMPNTPALVGQGMTLFCAQHSLSADMFQLAKRMFAAIGQVQVLDEPLFDAATAICGCGPAFCFQLQEAMADAGVQYGLPRALAYQLVGQTFLGAGAMLQKTGQHPGALKDAVCSPGGTTIRGVVRLEQQGGRNAMMQAVTAAYEATRAQTLAQEPSAVPVEGN